MPELPDVEGFRAVFERHAVGRTIVRARAFDDWMLKDMSPPGFARALKGRTVTATARRGKIMLVFCEPGPRDPVLALHYGMTGHPVVADPSEPRHRWDRMILDLGSSGSLPPVQLRYRNMRRLGFVRVVQRSRVTDLLWGLGPDPLEVPPSFLRDTLRRRTAAVKAVLLDQKVLAGIGNLYADEALFEARIDPRRPASGLGDAEVRRLHGWIRRTLQAGISANLEGHLPPLRFAATRGAGRPCPRCRTPLHRATLGGRTTYFCPACQR